MPHSLEKWFSFRNLLKGLPHTLVPLVMAFSFCGPVRAQFGDLIPQRGVYPNGSYSFDKLEAINKQNGILTYTIPLTSLPLGRAGMTVPVYLVYSSALSDARQYPGYMQTEPVLFGIASGSPSGGWQIAGYAYGLQVIEPTSINCSGNFPPPFQYDVIMADNAHHVLKLYNQLDPYNNGTYWFDPSTGKNPCTGAAAPNPLTYYTTDGSYIRVVVDNTKNTRTIYLPNGMSVLFPGTIGLQIISDRNGNKVTVNTDSSGNTTLTDDEGRKISIPDNGTVTQTGFGGQTLIWTLGGYQNFSVPVGCTNPGPQGCGSIPGGGPTFLQVPSDSGTLQYKFSYATNSGALSSVTLPSGATTNYMYQVGATTTAGITTLSNNFTVVSKTVYWTDYSDGGSTGRSEPWSYGYSSVWEAGSCQGYCTSIVAPDGSKTTTYFNNATGVQGTVTKEVMPDGSTNEYLYEQNPAYLEAAGDGESVNPFVALSVHTVAHNGSPSLAAVEKRTVDQNGNLTQDTFYDWIPYSQIQHDSNGNLSAFSGGTALRSTTNNYTVNVPSATNGSGPPDNSNGYWNPNAPLLRNLLGNFTTTGSSNGAMAKFAYDSFGNLQMESHWDSVAAKYWTTQRSYDGYGNLLQTIDPNNNITKSTYDSANLYALQRTLGYGTAKAETWHYTWDDTSGVVLSQTDPNNVTTGYGYDAQGRQTSMLEASGTAAAAATDTTYDDANRRVIVKRDQNATNDHALVNVTNYDQLGRVTLTQQLENASTQSPTDTMAGLKVQTRYFYGQGGSYRAVSNPYRAKSTGAAAGEATMGWTAVHYDPEGRVTSSQFYDGSGVPAPWGSNANQTGSITMSYDSQMATTTQLGNPSQVTVKSLDGLGRLASVQESQMNILDAYTYDALDNLHIVNQNGRTRTFTYDSLSRLVGALNPESGSTQTTYTYDGVGNLTKKVDARGATITYNYDALNRMTSKHYSGFNAQIAATPGVAYSYDGVGASVYAIGHLTQVQNANATSSYSSFDPLGRVSASSQTIGAYTYSFGYTYNLAGSVTSETYPNGGKLSTMYDGANRPLSANGNLPLTSSNQYVQQAAYWPSGALQSMQRGNGVWQNVGYNNRLQESEAYEAPGNNPASALMVSCLNWGTQPNYNGALYQFCPAANTNNDNGNLQAAGYSYAGPDLAKPLSVSQIYTYDGAGRLTNATEGATWGRGFAYDYYDNMWVDLSKTYGIAPAGNTPVSDVYNSNNQVNQPWYDASGNLTNLNGATALYDAESRLTQTQESPALGGGMEQYVYDGNGQRIEKTLPGLTVVYVYNGFGQLDAEYTNLASLSSPCTGTCYVSQDYLGSVRLVMDGSGNPVNRHDFLPFGEEIPSGTGGRGSTWNADAEGVNNLPLSFTGQLRDREVGLDYFGARYYGGALGRFTSPDPENAGSDPGDPQSWNGYAYTGNNPLSRTDPDGLDYLVCLDDGRGGQQCSTVSSDTIFQSALKKPGAGLSTTGAFGSGGIYATDENGNQTQVGSYEHFVGPGTEGGGLQQDFGTEFALAGIGARVIDAGADLIRGAVSSVSRGAGAEIATDAASSAGRVIRVIENDGGTVHLEVQSSKGTYEVMAKIRREGSTLILDQADIAAQGGRGSIGVGMRTELRQAAAQFGREMGASEVVVNPGNRLGGLGPVSSIRVPVK